MEINDIMKMPGVTQLRKTKTVVLNRQSETLPVYRVPLKYLYYNDNNDRISTEIVRYKTENDSNIPTNREEFNKIFEDLIVKSKPDAIDKTQRSIATRGQDNPGVTLKDGRVVDGNRRFTCLRRIERSTKQEQYFETIILDYDYNSDYKQIKAVELELQMGVDEKVKYDPIDRLFGVYDAIRKRKAFTVEEYAALFDDYSVSEVKKDLAMADLMCEYLELQGSPDKYYIAKDMNLEGTLHEIPPILEKVKRVNPNLVDDVKNRMFSSIAVGVDTRLNLFMRDIKKIVDNGDLEKYLEDTEETVDKTIEALCANPIKDYNDLADGIRTRDDLIEGLRVPVADQIKRLESQKLKKAPVEKTKEALNLLNSIRDDDVPEMNAADKAEMTRILQNIESRLNDLRHML